MYSVYCTVYMHCNSAVWVRKDSKAMNRKEMKERCPYSIRVGKGMKSRETRPFDYSREGKPCNPDQKTRGE